MSRVPIISQFSWATMVINTIVMMAVIAIAYLLTEADNAHIAVISSMVIIVGCPILSRELFVRNHRRGIRLIQKKQFEAAIPYFERSYEFFTRHTWLDKFSGIIMLSASLVNLRESALTNIAFCYSQIGNADQAKHYYQKILDIFPNPGSAQAEMNMVSALRKKENSGQSPEGDAEYRAAELGRYRRKGMSRVPIISQVSWVATVFHIMVMIAAMAVAYSLAGPDNMIIAVFSGPFIFVGYSLLSSRLIARDYHRGIHLIKKKQFEAAIPHFERSYEFFTKHVRLDKFRSIIMFNASLISHREIALINIAFCYSQISNAGQAKQYYQKTLDIFPDSGFAQAEMNMISTFEKKENPEQSPEGDDQKKLGTQY